MTGRYTLIPRTLIFVTSGDQVLLLKGGAHKNLWAGLYNGIGGHIERGEDVLSSAQRELLEETGLRIPNLWLCGVVTIDTGEDVGIGLYILRGESAHEWAGPLTSQDGTLEWVARREVSQLPLVEDLPALLPRLLDAQPDEPPFSALYQYDQSGALQITFGPSLAKV